MTSHLEPGAVVLTDGWMGYAGIDKAGYGHRKVSIRASAKSGSELLPRVHRVAALLKRWLLATHQGAVQPEQLDYYLDEFTFNRRDSRARGLLFYRLSSPSCAHRPTALCGHRRRRGTADPARRRKHKM